MKWGWLALVVLLLTTGWAGADYYLVKVDPSQLQFTNPTDVKGPDQVPRDESVPWLYGTFEFKAKKPPVMRKIGGFPVLDLEHRWGQAYIIGIPNMVEVRYLKKESVADEYRLKRKKEWGDGKNEDVLLRLASWALSHGLYKDFHIVMADLKKLAPKRAAVLSYTRLQAELKAPLTAEDPLQASFLADLRNQGYRITANDDGHYGLLCRESGDFTKESLKRRLNRLEDTFQNFFYWFALQEKASIPPLPKYRLMVLVDHPQEYLKKQKEYGLANVQTDGFTIRRENLVVLSGQPTDDVFVSLEKNLSNTRNTLKLTREMLLQGVVWKYPDYQKLFLNVAPLQMLTLMQRIMEDESELATINREGVKQLLGATGLLAPNVVAPEWVQTGVASYFETPPGSLYTSIGLPSATNLVAFKKLYKSGKMGKSSDALLNLASDFYFRQARNDLLFRLEMEGKELAKKDREQIVQQSRESQDLAQCTSWAFVYYLALTHKLPMLTRYAQLLNELPRDLELGETTLLTCFARAFELTDAADSTRLDLKKVRELADAWFLEMENVSLENGDLESFRSETKSPTTPPMPPMPK